MSNENKFGEPSSVIVRRSIVPWLFISCFWLLLAVASALEMSVLRPDDVAGAVRFAAVQWLPWVLLTPVVVWISSVWTLEQHTWHRAIWVHVVACILMVGGLGALGYCTGPSLSLWQPSPLVRNYSQHRTTAFLILRRATFQLPIFWAVVGVAHALQFYRRDRERERRQSELESRLTQARLHALRTQLNPHFLFNTLNSISSLIRDDPRAAEEMIDSLGELLRQTLTASGPQEVPVRQELELLDRYLAIERTRFGERLQIVKQVEAGVLEGMVPILILQPLVENAIKHGIGKQIAPGVIWINASRRDNVLRLQIIDNGPRLGPKDREWTEGVGLTNSRSRLKELYAGRARLELHPRAEGGLLVEIQIPWRTESAPTTAPTPNPRYDHSFFNR